MIIFKPLSTPFARQPEEEGEASADGGDGPKIRAVDNTDAQSTTELERTNAYAYLLELDDVRILIDCGAPEDMAFPPPLAEVDASVSPSDPSAVRPLDEILEEIAPSIDLVLLSHSTLPHLGLFAYARARLGLRCPVYATLPVQAMGRLTVLEAVENLRAERNVEQESKRAILLPRRTEPVLSMSAIATAEEEEEEQHAARLAAHAAVESLQGDDAQGKAAGLPKVLCLPAPTEVDEAFEEITTLRYLQPTQLDGKCIGLTLTAYSAGHSLGGTVWKLRSATSGTILIALDWNHNQERHLDATAMLASSGAAAPVTTEGARAPPPSGSGGILEAVKRPDLLITGVGRGNIRNAKRKDRDAAIIDIIHRSVQSGHSVLLPIDPSARLLELLVLLHQHWAWAYPSQGGPDRVPLCLVSRTGKEVIERARAFMEWTRREWATKAADLDQAGARRGGKNALKNQAPTSPLEFNRLRIFATLAAMDAAIAADAPRVVLACPPSLSFGPSRELLTRFSSRPDDVVLLTQRGDPGSLARRLWDEWNTRQASKTLWAEGKVGQPKKLDCTWDIQLRSRIALEGEELEVYKTAEKASRDKAAAQRAKAARSRRMLEADEDEESDSDGESDGSSAADGEGGRADDFAEAGDDGTARRKRGRGVAFEEGGAQDGDGAGAGDESSQLSFDIYLKGNASRATSFFGAGSGGQGSSLAAQLGIGARYRMYPLVERKRRFDAYGEVVDVARWKNKKGDENEGWVGSAVALPAGAVRGPPKAANDLKRDALGGEEEEDEDLAFGLARKRRKMEAEERSVPSKFVIQDLAVTFKCSVQYVDLTGLNDDRALSIVLPQLAPRRLILVDGPARTRRAVSASLAAVRNSSMTATADDIHAPAIMQSVSIGELTAAFSVTLGEGLLASLDLSTFEDYQVALLRADVRVSAESTVPTLEMAGGAFISEVPDGGKDADMSSAHATMPPDLPVQHVPPTLYIGDLKLSSLKAALASTSRGRIPSDFAGEGVLVCGSSVTAAGAASATTTPSVRVQKLASGRIALEGNVGAGYFAVRDAIYALHARVVGQAGP